MSLLKTTRWFRGRAIAAAFLAGSLLAVASAPAMAQAAQHPWKHRDYAWNHRGYAWKNPGYDWRHRAYVRNQSQRGWSHRRYAWDHRGWTWNNRRPN